MALPFFEDFEDFTDFTSALESVTLDQSNEFAAGTRKHVPYGGITFFSCFLSAFLLDFLEKNLAVFWKNVGDFSAVAVLPACSF